MERDPCPNLDWRDGLLPVSRQFGDTYYSAEDGLAEATHVFLAGNDLPARFQPGFHIAELGFGTGLNALAAWAAWDAAGQPGPLRFTSFEAFPMSARDRQRALAAFPALAARADALAAVLPEGVGLAELPGLMLEVIPGDARETLPDWSGAADAWFLDGFAPARNPELWEAELLGSVHDHTRPGGSFATFTAARIARDGLTAAGFSVERCPGFGQKRHMIRGTRN